MKLPNRFGTIYKLSGKRRKPYVAKKYIGKTLDMASKRLIVQYVTVGYYKTKQAALEALTAYNQNPYDVTKRTVEDVYNSWSAEHYPKIRQTKAYAAAYKVLAPIKDEPISDITLDTVQAVMDHSGKNAPTLRNVKLLVQQMYEYALIHGYLPPNRRNVMTHLNVGKDNPNAITRKIFTKDEISALWEDPHDELNRFTLILLCTGMRISELVEADDIDLERQVVHVHKAKTAAGIRDVPIADRIVPLMREYLSEKRKSDRIMRAMMKERLHHYPHDTRHTFATLAVEAEIDQRLIDEIIGHTHSNLTLDVYSHLGLQRKIEVVNKIVSNLLVTESF